MSSYQRVTGKKTPLKEQGAKEKQPQQPQGRAARRAAPDLAAPPAPYMLQLQRVLGNRSVVKILAGINSGRVQAKMYVSAPGDRYEREADSAAADVVKRISAPDSLTAPEGEVSQAQHPAGAGNAGGGGAAVPPVLESAIRQARASGGQAISTRIRERMEDAFGNDFTGVKIHTGAGADRISRSLGARAFTVGRDVFFRRGEFSPQSPGGRELLAHELAHVVQQNGGAVRPKRSPGAGAAVIQCKLAAVGARAHLRRFTLLSSEYTVIENKKIGSVLKSDTLLDVDETKPDKTDKWLLTKHPQTGEEGFIRKDKLKFDFGLTGARDQSQGGPTPTPHSENEGLDNALETTSGIIETVGGSVIDENSALSEEEKISDTTANRMGETAGTFDIAGGIVGMAHSVKKFFGANSKLDKAEAFIQFFSGLAKTAGGVSGLTDSAMKSKGNKSGEKANQIIGNIGSIIDGIKTAFLTFKKSWDIIEKSRSKEGAGKGEYAKGGMEVLAGAMETASAVVKTIQGFMNMLGGSVSKQFARSVPGLGIAISAATIAIKAFDIISAYRQKKEMKEVRQKFKADYAEKGKEKGYIKEVTRTKGHLRWKHDKTSNKVDIEELQKRKKYALEGITEEVLDKKLKEESEKRNIPDLRLAKQKVLKTGIGLLTATEVRNLLKQKKDKTTQDNVEKWINTIIQKNKGKTVANGINRPGLEKEVDEEAKRRNKQITELKEHLKAGVGILSAKQLEKLLSNRNISKAAIQDKIESTLENREKADELEAIREYEMATEFKTINKKRLTRGKINIGLEIANIAGEIATISGVGAVAGAGIKVGTSGVKTGMVLARDVKQWGRDKAEKTGNKVLNAIFDKEKSSGKKLEKRQEHTFHLLKMIAGLPEVNDKTEYEANAGSYDRVEGFIRATGCPPRELYNLNGDIQAQFDLLVQYMKSRE